MKKTLNNQKGFVIPLVIAIVAILAIGGTAYLTTNEKVEAPVVIESNVPAQSTGTASSKLQFKSQEEQTKAREFAQGISNFLNEHGILIEVVRQSTTSVTYKLPINLKGYISDNTRWRIFEGEAGAIAIHGSVAGKDKVIGSFPLTLKDFDYNKRPPFYFDLTVGDRQWMSELDSENGYIFISEAGAKDGEIIDTIKIPIVFDVSITPKPVACTMDAMMCPDGSYVGRSGPKCEFVCPTQYHDVKYFFETIGDFDSNIPRSGITREVAIKGRLVTKETEVLCIKAPCNPARIFIFEDVNDSNYAVNIFETNPLLSKLIIGEAYILNGELHIAADFGLKKLYIDNFKPKEIIKNY